MSHQICSLAIAVLVMAGTVAPPSTDLDVDAADGTKLRATYYTPGRPGPGVILLHQCDMSRKAWSALAAALSERGLHVLAVDYRGYGENRTLPVEYPKLPSDIDAALAALLTQPGVDKDRVAAGGASCGVNHAVQLARRSGRIKALVLLSGPTTEQGL